MALEAYITPHLDENVYGYWLVVQKVDERPDEDEPEVEELACQFYATYEEAAEFCQEKFGIEPEFYNN